MASDLFMPAGRHSGAAKAQGPSLGMTMRFGVVTEDNLKKIDLGFWRSCKGIAVDFETENVVDGGHYETQAYLPNGLKYQTVRLERVMTPDGSKAVQGWLRDMVDHWVNGDGSYRGGSATITLFDASNQEVLKWTLQNVFPKSWKGPDLDAKSAEFAIEALELVHEGFLHSEG
ncbi:phage tail protein [Amycolatopsis sp. NBC_01307]|uniref:phage tail protein n=1 Tax=Amycolatopsis sp. NBC_01307 TaxID=2903561 RepID=UPI002E121FCD|nr:phage tail protein [Amycolatopsis sp. NBC_01307]